MPGRLYRVWSQRRSLQLVIHVESLSDGGLQMRRRNEMQMLMSSLKRQPPWYRRVSRVRCYSKTEFADSYLSATTKTSSLESDTCRDFRQPRYQSCHFSASAELRF